jgi:AcrR family transcriptional regulator
VSYRRLTSGDRRRQLLDRAVEAFAEHGYDELSMAAFARTAGISKPLLYHYFPSKRDLFEAALTQAAEDHLARVAPDPDLPPEQALAASLDAFLGWIEANPEAYVKLMRSAGVPEVRELIDRVRAETVRRILAGLGRGSSARLRAAVRGWLWSMDGVCLEWIEGGKLRRADVRRLLLQTFAASVAAGSTS